MDLTVDDWAGKVHNFCKPVAKFPSDREALWDVIATGAPGIAPSAAALRQLTHAAVLAIVHGTGHPRFFLGSDSAPHPRHLKECATSCAGVFTSPLILPYLATLFEKRGCLDRLAPFTSQFGARFYGVKPQAAHVTLVRQPQIVPVRVVCAWVTLAHVCGVLIRDVRSHGRGGRLRTRTATATSPTVTSCRSGPAAS